MTFTYYAVLSSYGFVGASGRSGPPRLIKSRRAAESVAERHSTSRFKARVVEFTATPTAVLPDSKALAFTASAVDQIKTLFPDAFKAEVAT